MSGQGVQIPQSNVDSSEEQKIKYTSLIVATIMPFIMDEIPGLGELQMAGQVIDYIDPYGYNHVINRDAISNYMVQPVISKTQSALNAISTYLKTGSVSAG